MSDDTITIKGLREFIEEWEQSTSRADKRLIRKQLRKGRRMNEQPAPTPTEPQPGPTEPVPDDDDDEDQAS